MPNTLIRNLDDPISKYRDGQELATRRDKLAVFGYGAALGCFWAVVAFGVVVWLT